MSYGFRSGSSPSRTDTRWVRWAKILTHYQNQTGSDSRNNLQRGNPLRLLKLKVLRAIIGSSAFNPPVAGCTNLVIAGSSYSADVGGGLGQLTVNGLSIGASCLVTFGANDTKLTNGFQLLTSAGPGTSQSFTASAATAILFGTPNAAVTATICMS